MSSRIRTTGVLLVAFVATYLLMPRVFALDDSYISLHSARALLAGADPIYGSPPLTGATSPPYVAALALLLLLHLPALQILTALGVVAFGWALWSLGEALALERPARVVLVAVCLASGYVYVDATNGIETGWALAAVTWLIVFVLSDAFVRAAALAGLLPLIRPDLAPAAAGLFACLVWRRSWTDRARAAAIAVAMAAPWLLWIRADIGAWMPQTMRAKTYWFAEACWPIDRKLESGLNAVRLVLWQLLPASFGLAWLLRSRVGRIGLVVIGVTLAAHIAVMPGGLYYNYFRYPYAIVVPWMALGVATALAARVVQSKLKMVHAIGAAVALFALSTASNVALEQPRIAQEIVDVAQWVDRSLPRGATILVHDAGIMSEFAHHPLVDMVGLKSPSSIEANARFTWPSCGGGRGDAMAAMARESGASYLIVADLWESYYALSQEMSRAGFHLTRLRTPMVYLGFSVYQLTDLQPVDQHARR